MKASLMYHLVDTLSKTVLTRGMTKLITDQSAASFFVHLTYYTR
jgi:hypothetical protein